MGRRALTTTFGIRSRSLAGVAGTVALALLGLGSLVAASGSASAAAVTSCAGVAVGAHGPAVATVQRAVGATPDGDFGPMTRAAVAHWQKAHAVTATGVVDAKTWRALPREVSDWWRRRAASTIVTEGGPRVIGPAAHDAAVSMLGAD